MSNALYDWSYGELNFTWQIIGPFITTGDYTEKRCAQHRMERSLPGDRLIDIVLGITRHTRLARIRRCV